MPFMEGESLRARMTGERQLDLEDALRISREGAGAYIQVLCQMSVASNGWVFALRPSRRVDIARPRALPAKGPPVDSGPPHS